MASANLFLCCFFIYLAAAGAQLISTDTPVPPVQWINLSNLLKGPAPPALRDASIAYDEDSRSLVVFGGESVGGFVQSGTFILDVNTLTWKTPTPPDNLGVTPSARSSAVSGLDFAASNRHAFIVIGGKGANNVALSDVWAFDFKYEFWSQVNLSPGGPQARWGASGGIDTRTPAVQDQVLPGPNNTFYLAGGMDNQNVFPLSDLWRLNVSGILSPNLPRDVEGSWQRIPLTVTLPGRSGQGSTIIDSRIVSTGGCDNALETEQSCAQQDSYVIDFQRQSFIGPSACPPPRFDPVLITNMNAFSSRFSSQVFLTLGTIDPTLWDNADDLDIGEIDVMDVATGSWSRILPAGSPDADRKITFPSLREGAAYFTSPHAIVGTREDVSDTIVFGGRDSSGKYLAEVWLLRTYPATLSSSSEHWAGYGDGRLRSGVNADGSGVTIRYLNACSMRRSQNQTDKPPANNPPDDEQPSIDDPSTGPLSNTSLAHKLLSSLSLILLSLGSLLLRLFSFSFSGTKLQQLFSLFVALFIFASYALGITGFAFAFTSLHLSDPSTKALPAHLATPHGISSLVFFALLYGLAPTLFLLSIATRRTQSKSPDPQSSESALHNLSPSPVEKPDHIHRSTSHSPSPSAPYSPPLSPRPLSATLASTSNPARRSIEAMSTDGESVNSAVPPRRGFEVMNRPHRTRKQSETWSTSFSHGSQHPLPATGSLRDIDWLLRRRSLNAVGELDYALSMAHNAQRNSVATSDALQMASVVQIKVVKKRPRPMDMAVYLAAQLGFVGLNITTLIALWRHAAKAFFIVFLIWVVALYALTVFLPGKFTTEIYILSKLKRSKAPPNPDLDHPDTPQPNPHDSNHASSPQGPYLHHSPFLRTVPTDLAYVSDHARSMENDDDEDIDEDTRQRMIEDEMDRREVSIVTVPKRKLWVANPS